MPYVIRKLPNKELYKVINKETKKVHSYSTTLENAKKQITLLNMVDAGVPLKKEGKGLTEIDRTSTGVMRVKLNDPAKNYLNDTLLPLISTTTIRTNEGRKNSGAGRTQVFGYGNRRKMGFGEFVNNRDYPELYRALLIFGSKIVPEYIPFTAIQVNHNYKTKKHIDGNNIGLSLAVSFGDFTGGELVVGNQDYQTKEYPVIFNGALREHFNRTIKGNRYSLVYFVSAPKKYSDSDIFNLSKKIISGVKIKKGEGLIGGSIETDRFENGGLVSLPEFRSVKINLPTYMYKRMPDIKGNPPPYRYRLVIPITKTRNVSTRLQQTSLDINQKPVATPIIDVKETENPPNISEFSPSDRRKIEAYYDKVRENEQRNPDEIEKDPYEIKQRGRPLPCPQSALGGAKKVVAKEPKAKAVEPSPAPVERELTREERLAAYKKDPEAYKKGLIGKGLENNISTSSKKMPSKWIEYVKSYCTKTGMSYRDALRDPKCKAGYKKGGMIPSPLVAISYNDSELGANAGKKFISL